MGLLVCASKQACIGYIGTSLPGDLVLLCHDLHEC